MNKRHEKEFRELLEKNEMSSSEIVHFLLLIRKELETIEPSDLNKYGVLKLFCDWALHKKIEKSTVGSDIVSKIHKSINLYKEGNTDRIIEEISKILLVPFRDQFNFFLTERFFKIDIIDDQKKWRIFLKNIFESLEDTPIILKKKDEVKLQYDPLMTGIWVKEISVVKFYIEGFGEIYCLSILTCEFIKIIIPLTPAV